MVVLLSSIRDTGVHRVSSVVDDDDMAWHGARGMVKWVPEAEEELAAMAGVALVELLEADVMVVWLDEGWEMVTQGVGVGGSAGACQA